MSKDFEVHPIGTAEEIRLSRQLSSAIEQITYQYGDGIVPETVFRTYKQLTDYYAVMPLQVGRENE
jgi:hypothetical protein